MASSSSSSESFDIPFYDMDMKSARPPKHFSSEKRKKAPLTKEQLQMKLVKAEKRRQVYIV